MPSLQTSEENIGLARTYANEVWNQGIPSRIDDIVSDEIVCYDTSFGDLEGAGELKEFVAVAKAAFPGLTYRVEEISLDTEALELHWSATDEEQLEHPGDHVTISGRTALRISDGKIAEMWSGFDPWKL